jgi:hypothetical protein
MNKLTVRFYEELVTIDLPNDFGAFRNLIASEFQLDPADVEELIVFYNKCDRRAFISNELEYQQAIAFAKTSHAFSQNYVFVIELEVSEKSKLYQRELEQSKVCLNNNLRETVAVQDGSYVKLDTEKSLEREKLEKEIREKEKLLKELQEKEEQQRLEREKAEKERQEREKAEKERREKEKQERERQERERERLEKLERERLEREKLEREMQEELKRAEREREKDIQLLKEKERRELMDWIQQMDKDNEDKEIFKQERLRELSAEREVALERSMLENSSLKDSVIEAVKQTINNNIEKFKDELIKKAIEESTMAIDKAMNSSYCLTVHSGIRCNECGVSPIVGIRYKCNICQDYDLCQNCEGKKGDDHKHPLTKHRQPIASNVVLNKKTILVEDLLKNSNLHNKFKKEYKGKVKEMRDTYDLKNKKDDEILAALVVCDGNIDSALECLFK